jgi:hypothetical protein
VPPTPPPPLAPPARPAPRPQEQQQQQQQQAPAAGEELPPWVRREKERELAAGKSTVPWPLYLVASCLVAIAAVTGRARRAGAGAQRRAHGGAGSVRSGTSARPGRGEARPRAPLCMRARPSRPCPPPPPALRRAPQVGSVFEYFGGNAVFGVVQPDNPLWAPILGLFAFTGLPMAGEAGA